MSKDILKEASAFSTEILRLYDAEKDPAEKIILLQVMIERMNAWTIEHRLKTIQINSRHYQEKV